MLTLTPDQFDRLGADQRRRFVAGLVQRLRKDWPEQTRPKDDAAMHQLVETGIRNGAVYGLVGEEHVRVFCSMMLRHGESFDTDPKLPWAGDILDDDELSATEKVARLDEVQVFLERGKQ